MDEPSLQAQLDAERQTNEWLRERVAELELALAGAQSLIGCELHSGAE